MKRTILAVVAAAACSAEAAVMYSGRLVDAEHPGASRTFGGSKKMTFRFYDDSGLQQGEPLVKEVPLETNGMFSVLLDSPELTTALREGRATQMGLTVGDAANEIRPLRKLLPTAHAVRAGTATGLGRGAKVGTMTATRVEAEKLAVGGNLTVGGAIRFASGETKLDQIAYTVRMNEGARLGMDGGRVVALGEPTLLTPDLAKECTRVGAGETILGSGGKKVTAPADGVATICCVEVLKQEDVNGGTWDSDPKGQYYASAYAPCCAVVQFCKKGEEIKVPAGWYWQPAGKGSEKKNFTVRFHPFVDVNN